MKRILVAVLFTGLIAVDVVFAQPQLDQGKQFLKEKKYAEAVSYFRQISQLYPRDADAWLLLAKSFLGVSLPDSAEFAATKSKTLNDDNAEVYVVLTQAQRGEKKYVDAFATARRGLKLKKDDPALLMEVGTIQLLMDSTDQALVTFTRARESDPNLAAVYEGLGDCYAKQGVMPLAITQYEKSIEIDSVQPALLYKLARTHMKERRYNDAARVYQLVVNEDPNNVSALKELASLYYRAKQYRQAAQVYAKYMVKNPGDKEAGANYLEALFMSRQYKEVIPLAEQQLKNDPKSAKLIRYLATSYYTEKKYDKAIDFFARLEPIDTLKAEDYKQWGLAYYETKKDTLAAATWAESLKLDSTQSLLYSYVGSIWMRQQRWSEAGDMFKRRYLLDTSAVGSYLNYGLCLYQLKQMDEAEAAFRKVIDQSPKFPQAYTYLGALYTGEGNFDEARKAYSQALKAIDTAETAYKNELVDAYRGLGLICMLDKKVEAPKKWTDAIEYLQKALKYKDDDEITNLLLAQAYQNAQKKDEAIKYYKRVLKINPKNEGAKKGLEVLEPK